MDEVKVIEKTTAWTDEAREEAAKTAPITVPPWVTSFAPNTVITHDGWEAVVRHVGCEEGHWLVLLEPIQRSSPTRFRSEYRRLKVQVGKKKAREMIQQKIKEYDSVNRPPNP